LGQSVQGFKLYGTPKFQFLPYETDVVVITVLRYRAAYEDPVYN